MHQNYARVIRERNLTALIGLSRSTIRRKIARGEDFPKPIRLGPNSIGWLMEDVERWIESRKETLQ